MKIAKNVLLYFLLALIIVVAFAFAFIELRTLFAGDFKLYNNVFTGGLAYFSRGLYYLLIIALCVSIIVFNIKHKKICIILYVGSITLFIGSLFSLSFYDYLIALPIILINLILVVITSAGFFKKEKEEVS